MTDMLVPVKNRKGENVLDYSQTNFLGEKSESNDTSSGVKQIWQAVGIDGFKDV